MDNKAVWLACLHEVTVYYADDNLDPDELIALANKVYKAVVAATT